MFHWLSTPSGAAMQTSVFIVHAQPAVRARASDILAQAGYGASVTDELRLSEIGNPAVLLVAWTSLSPAAESLRMLRKNEGTRDARIIVMASRSELGEAINALEYGADDCVHVPFDSDELLVRVNTSLRRPPATMASDMLTAGPIVLDRRVHQVLIHDSRVELAPTEFRLMAFLLENQGRVFSRSELLRRAWRSNIKAGHRTVDVHVRRLRQQLEPFGCENIIQTVRGFGYRLRVEQS
jgi:two-component system phosphate regulon response regulator PhoB